MKKALILTYEKFQDHEVIYPYYALQEHGFDVTVVTNKPKGDRCFGILGAHVTSNMNYEELGKLPFQLGEEPLSHISQLYDLLVIPGGVKALEKQRLEGSAVNFVKAWNSQNLPIMSICNGAQLLITADVIRGKEVLGYYAIQPDIENAGATYPNTNVVCSENICSTPHYDFMGEWVNTGLKYFNLYD